MGDEIFRFFIAFDGQRRDEYGHIRSVSGRTSIVSSHDIRTIDDVLEIEEAIAEETENDVVTLKWWKRYADMPAQVE